AEQVDHHILGLGPLYLYRSDVGLPDLDVHAEAVGESSGPEQDVAVGGGEPEVVLTQPQQHWVVDDPAVLRGDEHVFALPDLALVQITWDQHVREVECVGTGDLDLTFRADVPQGHAVQQMPVLGNRVTVVPGVIHAIVHTVLGNAVLS